MARQQREKSKICDHKSIRGLHHLGIFDQDSRAQIFFKFDNENKEKAASSWPLMRASTMLAAKISFPTDCNGKQVDHKSNNQVSGSLLDPSFAWNYFGYKVGSGSQTYKKAMTYSSPFGSSHNSLLHKQVLCTDFLL